MADQGMLELRRALFSDPELKSQITPELMEALLALDNVVEEAPTVEAPTVEETSTETVVETPTEEETSTEGE